MLHADESMENEALEESHEKLTLKEPRRPPRSLILEMKARGLGPSSIAVRLVRDGYSCSRLYVLYVLGATAYPGAYAKALDNHAQGLPPGWT